MNTTNFTYAEKIRHEHCDKFWERLEMAQKTAQELNMAGVDPEDYDNQDPFSDLISDIEFHLKIAKDRKKDPWQGGV